MISNPKRLSANSARKARRLHADGKVRYLPNARVYTVQGDHAPYIVVANDDQLTCNCPHHGTCSHMAAVRIARRDDTESAHVLPVPSVHHRWGAPDDGIRYCEACGYAEGSRAMDGPFACSGRHGVRGPTLPTAAELTCRPEPVLPIGVPTST